MYINIGKTFDRMAHSKHLRNLILVGHPRTVKWIAAFLGKRSFQMCVRDLFLAFVSVLAESVMETYILLSYLVFVRTRLPTSFLPFISPAKCSPTTLKYTTLVNL